jgi:hypothetical protein
MAGTQQRLVDRRIQLWRGRISPFAAEKTLQSYEFLGLAYGSAIVCVALACVCILANQDAVSTALFILAFILVATFLSLAMRLARRAGMDIARQYGLPDSAWRSVKVKTPEQFDRWLSTQSQKR